MIFDGKWCIVPNKRHVNNTEQYYQKICIMIWFALHKKLIFITHIEEYILLYIMLSSILSSLT